MSTPNMALEQWPSGALQASAPLNDSLQTLDTLVIPGGIVQSNVATPPTTTSGDIGKSWLVGASATGAWVGHDDDIALCTAADLWRFYPPKEGWEVKNLDDAKRYEFTGSAWIEVASGGASRTPNIQSVTSAATVTPTFDNDMVKITAQATGLTLANPTGTPISGLGMAIRIKDNGTARSIAYGTQYRAIGVTLPTTTVISKTLYLAIIFNADDTKWDVVAVAQEE